MSIAIAHFAVGATLATVALLYFVPEAPYQRVVVLLSGVWAMVPDVVSLHPPYASELAVAFDSVWANAFWFHQRLDTVDGTDSLSFAAVTLGAFVVVTAVAERWAYTVREHAADGDPAAFGPGRSLSALRAVLGAGCVGYGVLLLGAAVVVDAATILYVGTGATLGLAGAIALAGRASRAAAWPLVDRLPPGAATVVPLAVSFGVLAVAGGLVTSLRTLDALDGVYVGMALLLVTLLAIVASGSP